MYRLTPLMTQRLRRDLGRYHDLFSAKRCSGWELEELIHRAILSDNSAQHHSRWKEAGHDTEADIEVSVNGDIHRLQIKSGKLVKNNLVLSGHRLGRFNGSLAGISNYLNDQCRKTEILAVPHHTIDDESGRRHCYQIAYVDAFCLGGLRSGAWHKHGKQYRQINEHGVLFSLRPSMSWQIWWHIPLHAIDLSERFCVG